LQESVLFSKPSLVRLVKKLKALSMKFENFKHAIDQMVENSKQISILYDTGLDLINFSDNYIKVNNLLWKELLTDTGFDWLEWFLYEKGYIENGVPDSEVKAYARTLEPTTNEPIDVEIIQDLEQLYKYLIENNYFKCDQCPNQQ
jgi:hypothetical protein